MHYLSTVTRAEIDLISLSAYATRSYQCYEFIPTEMTEKAIKSPSFNVNSSMSSKLTARKRESYRTEHRTRAAVTAAVTVNESDPPCDLHDVTTTSKNSAQPH
jgi:hypothetical protein